MDDILRFHANRSDAHRSPILDIVLIDTIVTKRRGTREPIIRHETTLPLSPRSLRDPSTAHCQETRRKFHLVRRRNSVRPNLMICNAAIYCTLVVRDSSMVWRRCNLVYKPRRKLTAALRRSGCRGRLQLPVPSDGEDADQDCRLSYANLIGLPGEPPCPARSHHADRQRMRHHVTAAPFRALGTVPRHESTDHRGSNKRQRRSGAAAAFFRRGLN
jgi:hypothetical protein